MNPTAADIAGHAAAATPPARRSTDDPHCYARAKALFDALCDLPEAERAARLDPLEAEAGDDGAQVAAEVRILLAHADQPQSQQLQLPVADLLAGLADAELLAAGARLGAWTLIRKIGEGGMGSVYQAQRSDGHFEQTAAIKLLSGLPSPARLAFLASERQILARLAHPNIARLLDGGATPLGQPYLVMEYLDGIPIDQYCARHAAPVAAVLRLLIEVCSAVSFAHSQLVVHCDIKPSNILVDLHGRPLLLDFGIARLLGNERSEPGESSRGTGARAFTSGFSSPEQARGDAISTLSDVYSLGRLLEVLLGSARLRATPELAAMVAMATRAEPALRYGEAATLSRDLQRYLAREPLRAMPPRWSYRTRKWLQRHWSVALALLGFALTVAAFTWQLAADRDRALAAEQRALAARDQATRAEASGRQISAFLANILSSVDPDNARTMDRTLMRSLLDQAAERARDELKDQPAMRQQIETVIADSYRAISQFNDAVLHYESALQALDMLAPDASVADMDPSQLRLELQYKRIGALLDGNRTAEAATLLAPAIAAAEQTHGAGHELALKLRTQQAYQLFKAGQLKDALASAQDTQRRFEASHALSPDAWLQQLNILSLLLSNSDQFAQAEALMQRAVRIAEASFGDLHSRTLRIRHSLCVLLMQSLRYAEASVLLKALLADLERVLGPNALLTISAVSNLGTSLRRQGQLEQSAPYYRLAHDRSLAQFGPADPLTLDLANNLALYELAAGQATAALTRIEAVIDRSAQVHDRTHPSLVEALRTRAKAFTALQRIAQARLAWQDVIERDLVLYGPADSQTRDDQAALAALRRN